MSFEHMQPSGGGGGGAAATAGGAGALQQKMLRQRQLALERQRNMARNRFGGGVAQANQLVTSVTTPAQQKSNNFGRILGMCEGPPGTAEGKPGGGSSLRTAGAALMLGGNPVAGTTGSSFGGGAAGGNDLAPAGQAAAAFDSMSGDRLRTPAGASSKATPRGRSNIEEISLMDCEFGDDFALPMARNHERQPSGMSGRGESRGATSPLDTASDGRVSPSQAWGGGRLQRAATRPTGPDVIVEAVGDFNGDFDEAPRGGRRGGGRNPLGDDAGPAPKRGGWDLSVEPVKEEVNAGLGGGGRRKRWWNPFGGAKGVDENQEQVTSISEMQPFNPGADVEQVQAFNPND